MQPQSDPWNSLEIVKLPVGVMTPLTVAGFGWLVSRRLKRLELIQWSNQRLIEKRLKVYDDAAPLLNKLLCFYTWVGTWKDISPADVVKAKRDLDQTINIYRHIFDENVYNDYQSYIHALFETYVSPGHDARIRSHIRGPNGDRTTDCSYKWDHSWEEKFLYQSMVPVPVPEIRKHYYQLMESLRKSLGVHE